MRKKQEVDFLVQKSSFDKIWYFRSNHIFLSEIIDKT